MEVIKEVGAFAGLAAFLGLAVLALLYFAQARDVRRLRENAEFLVEGDPMPTHPEEAVDERTAADAGQQPPPKQPKAAARAAAASAPNEAEAFRRAELARQAAERRQRFEERRREEGGGGRLPSLPSMAVIVVGALILVAGIAFGATRFLGDDEPSSGDTAGKASACPPQQTKVAVLNGTAEAGLAAGFAQKLKQANYDVGPVTNTESGFDASTIMFDQGGQQCVPEVAGVAGVNGAEPMNSEVLGVAEGARVAVVLGEDMSTGSPSDSTAGATGQ
ncbi:MAG: LytR C-terminal domain-containing protein [Actinomycetota bacterium]|nr:LytR C-terminal domain-containing protein [Actinomycetota bacterium]